MSEMQSDAPATNRKSADERKELLARQIALGVAQARRVESQGDYQAVMVHGHWNAPAFVDT